MRRPLAYLNELSIRDLEVGETSADVYRDWLEVFYRLLRTLVARRDDVALVSPVPFKAIMAGGAEEALSGWALRTAGRPREQFRAVLAVANFAPFSASPAPSISDDGEEFALPDGRSAVGLGRAAAEHQLAVSFDNARWNSSRLDVVWRTLAESDGSSVAIREEGLQVLHASEEGHVVELDREVRQLSLGNEFSAGDLWIDRERLFPHLEFLARTEEDLDSIGATDPRLGPVLDRLMELSDVATDWDPKQAPEPEWRSKVSPEGMQRKKLCLFSDTDGVTRVFDWHARFTPGEGRIHFRLAPERRIFVIAYIGGKLL